MCLFDFQEWTALISFNSHQGAASDLSREETVQRSDRSGRHFPSIVVETFPQSTGEGRFTNKCVLNVITPRYLFKALVKDNIRQCSVQQELSWPCVFMLFRTLVGEDASEHHCVASGQDVDDLRSQLTVCFSALESVQAQCRDSFCLHQRLFRRPKHLDVHVQKFVTEKPPLFWRKRNRMPQKTTPHYPCSLHVSYLFAPKTFWTWT